MPVAWRLPQRALEMQAQRLDTLALRLQRPATALAGHGQRLDKLLGVAR